MIVLVVSTAQAHNIYVDVSCPDPGNGSEAEPYCTIQTAIDNAVDTDAIVVAPGTYYEAIDFLGKAITVYSTGGADVTTIDGGGLEIHVVQCVRAEGPDTVLHGFTITGGNAIGSFPDSHGGGMYNLASSPTVSKCTFTGNMAFSGGGMFNNASSPTVTDCTFSGNAAAGFGAGMYNLNASSPMVTNSTFSGNMVIANGGGMYNSGSSPTVTNCVFTGNSSEVAGGGMENQDGNPTVTNCTFSGNSSSFGGGMFNDGGGDKTVTNCTFSGNVATAFGGAMGNAQGSSVKVTNCILWGDTNPEIFGIDATFSFSDIQGSGGSGNWDTSLGTDGGGNIDADPLFVGPDDLRLDASSPCIDAGDNDAVPDGITTDLDGNSRFVSAIDMGAYEFDEFPEQIHPNHDILWRHEDGRTYVWQMDGTQRIGEGSPGGANPNDWVVAGIGDFDGGGHADVLWRNTTSGQVYIWFVVGTQRVAQGSAGSADIDLWEIVGIGNFDGDPQGRSDILWRNTSNGQVFIWLMNGTHRMGQGSPGTVNPDEWEVAGVGDFDGSGRSDILWRNRSTGQVFIWFISGTSRVNQGSAGSANIDQWEIVGTGNFDNDPQGTSDILWRHDTGQVFIWLMNGTQRIGQGSPGSEGQVWQIVDTGDLDGDGSADILWRNQEASGQIFTWFIEGTDRVGGGSLGFIPHDWLIIGTGHFDGE